MQIYNDQLVPYAEAVYEKRRRFVETIIPVFQKYYDYLSESREQVEIRYLSSLENSSFSDLLLQNADADFRAGHTTAGIHKDDFDFLMDGRSVKRFSSQGQQKSFSLALKLSQFDYIYNIKRVKPILLLDDIFDKLDESRISQLLNLVGNEHFGQVFLSDTDENRIVRILDRHKISHKIFRVEKNSFAGVGDTFLRNKDISHPHSCFIDSSMF